MVRLANRRFVPFFFDLSNRGAAADPDARKFVVAKRKELAGSMVPTPAVLFMTPAGEVLDEISNYAPEDRVLAKMLNVLAKHADYAKLTEAESALTGEARAQFLIDLQKHEEADKALTSATSERAHYLRARLARFRKDWKAQAGHLAKIKSDDLKDDVRMESAYALWFAAKYDDLLKRLKDFPQESNRYTEARYYEGLGLHRLGRSSEALAVWQSTIRGCPQDPWIYRADWAYSNVKQGAKKGPRVFSTRGPKTSLLNRHGYMGRRNPDLAGPPK